MKCQCNKIFNKLNLYIYILVAEVCKTLAPCFSSQAAISVCPCLRASESGVPPQRSSAFTLAPLLVRNCATPKCPSAAAKCNGVRLS